MSNIKAHIGLALVAMLVIGCNNDKSVLVDGLSLEVWASRLDLEDAEIKLDALKAISAFGQEGLDVKHKLIYVARYDIDNEVKYNAVELLDRLHLSTDEFNEFMDMYDEPIIPVKDEGAIIYSNRRSNGYDKYSVMDDLNYLKELTAKDIQLPDNGVGTVPTDPQEYEEYVQSRRADGMDDLINMLNNPDVLLGLLNSGDQLEKSFAFDKLSSLNNLDPKIAEALKKITSSMGKDISIDGRDIAKLLQQR